MAERTHLQNGRFLHDLGNWTASNATYSAGDGDDHYGVAVLSANNGYIEQTFAVPYVRTYTLHTAIKPVSGVLVANDLIARISDGGGNTVVSLSLEATTSNAWQENSDVVGLAPGTTYTLRLTNNSALAVRVDDVWLWHVPITRADIALRANDKLGRLASDRSLSTAASGARTEGDYTYAVDAALRAVGAVDEDGGGVDVRWLDGDHVLTAIDVAVQEMLETLRLDYATETDVSLGPRRESLSQKAAAIGAILGSGGASQGSGRVVQRPLRHSHGWE
jgi:hypothetical protein